MRRRFELCVYEYVVMPASPRLAPKTGARTWGTRQRETGSVEIESEWTIEIVNRRLAGRPEEYSFAQVSAQNPEREPGAPACLIRAVYGAAPWSVTIAVVDQVQEGAVH